MALPVLDPSTFPYGGPTLTINVVTYICDDFNIDRPTKSIRRTNATDVPSGQAIIEDFITGSATLQMATTSTAYPPLGNTFTYGSETFIVTSVGERKQKDAAWTCGITFAKKINA